MARSPRRDAFTLIEVLIVVVIMAVLAATIIPQFSNSTKDAREASVKFNLQSLRSQIELYRIHHGGLLPSGTSANVVNQLTQYTDLAGAPQAATDTTHIYGPYIQGTALPANPFNNLNTVTVNTDAAGAARTGTGASGWIFRTSDGQIWLDTTDTTYRAY